MAVKADVECRQLRRDDVRSSVIVLPTGRMDVMLAKLLLGSTCDHKVWDDKPGTEGDDLVMPAEPVMAQREMTIA